MYASDLYTISLVKNANSVTVGMQIHNEIITTKDLPHTYEFLNLKMPSVLKTQCFNDENLPFHIEVMNTELGHLFEHILLDTLCARKLSSGRKTAVFSGHTDWNWKRDPYGYFHINIELRKSDFRFLRYALVETITLFNSLLTYHPDSFTEKKSMGNDLVTHRYSML